MDIISIKNRPCLRICLFGIADRGFQRVGRLIGKFFFYKKRKQKFFRFKSIQNASFVSRSHQGKIQIIQCSLE